MGKAPLPQNKRNCYPPYPDHYLIRAVHSSYKFVMLNPTNKYDSKQTKNESTSTLESSLLKWLKYLAKRNGLKSIRTVKLRAVRPNNACKMYDY